jgi:endonuclease III
MQPDLFSQRLDDLHAIRDRLRGIVGSVRDDERLDPTSQFVLAFIGTRTHGEVAAGAFTRLIRRYRNWNDVADRPVQELERVLQGVTFSESKAPNLIRVLRQIRARVGSISLEFLADDPVDSALFWLEQLHAVGRKIAAATLNFSTLRRRAFVVDTHVERVMHRFGFVGPTASTVAVYESVMAAANDFDADDLYELHWYVKGLGQATCTYFRARCVGCPLTTMCLKRLEPGAIAAA